MSFVLLISSCGEDSGDKNQETVSTTLEGEFSLQQAECEFDVPKEVEVECGNLEVPQHWDDLDDTDTISLRTAVLTNENTPEDAQPVIYFEGGPGGDSLGTLRFTYEDRWNSIVDKHPLILFSQRGAKYSTVDLECEEITELQFDSLEVVEDNGEYFETMKQCVERLEGEGADFSAYNSVNSANDVEALRVSLGYEKLNIVSVSYGTRLAQSYMRLHPDSISAVLLDAVMPTVPEQSVSLVPKSAERSFNELFKACEDNDFCSSEYPNLEERFYNIHTQLEAEPLKFQAVNGLTFKTYDVVWDGDNFIGTSFSAMYSAELIPFIPQMVEELERGDSATATIMVSLQLVNLEFISTGMLNSVLCHDAYSFIDEQEYSAGQSNVPIINSTFEASEGDFDEIEESCDLFGEDKADESDIVLVKSDVPTILFSGRFDPITPASFTDLVAEGLTESKTYEFDKVGHSAVFTECGNQITLDFFSDPENFPNDSCIGEMDELNWENPLLGLF